MSAQSATDRQSLPSLSAKQMGDILFSSNFLEALPDAIVVVERDGTIVQINQAPHRQVRPAGCQRHGHRYGHNDGSPHLRTILHHQGRGQRHRSRLVHGLRYCSAAPRGHIWVYSEPGRGTTFKIYLPSAEDKVGMGAPPEPEEILLRREGTTVLLVEDDELMLGLTRQLLEDHGYTVLPVSHGKSALETAQSYSGSIDLVLTDVVMRGMSGPELVARLSTSNPGLRFVFMSGYTGELISEHEIVDHGIPLWEKPFTRATLFKTLESALH